MSIHDTSEKRKNNDKTQNANTAMAPGGEIYFINQYRDDFSQLVKGL